ncbi:MAG TPA: DUF5719 family protein [Anaerolineae bacterium]|nr:DUF5719 family protein [Anaerolineae bacterium]
MKRFLLLLVAATFCIVVLASYATVDASSLAAKTRTNTPKPTRTRAPTRKPTRQPTRTPTRTPKPKNTPATNTPTSTETPSPEPVAEPPEERIDAPEINPVSPGAMTSQVLIFNPDTTGDATVQLDVYDSSGSVAYTTSQTVKPHGAKLISLPSSLGANFQGGAMVSSDKNVQAIVINANATNRARDAYEGSNAPATDIILPFVRHLAANTQNSIIAIQNTTDTAANASITLYNSDGSTANQQNANIAAHKSLYLNTNTLFPNNTFTGSARITADQNLAVALQTLYFKDTAALQGINANNSDTTLYLTQVEHKISINNVPINWSEIFARNNGSNPTDITLNLYTSGGALKSSQTISSVPSGGSAQFILKDNSFANLGSNYIGYAKITSSGESLSVAALEALNKGNRLYATNAQPNTQLAPRYVCGDTSRSKSQNSTLSILNTDGAKTANTIIRLFNKNSGAKIMQYKIKIAPNTLANVNLSSSSFAALGSNYQGMAIVLASGAAPPNLVVTVSNPYSNPNLIGTTGYTCTRF